MVGHVPLHRGEAAGRVDDLADDTLAVDRDVTAVSEQPVAVLLITSGLFRCKGAVMSQQIKSGSCRASLEPRNVGAWLQHKINHRADTELRIDPAVPESVELDEALCDVILDRAGAC